MQEISNFILAIDIKIHLLTIDQVNINIANAEFGEFE